MVEVWFYIVGSEIEFVCHVSSFAHFYDKVYNGDVFEVTRRDKGALMIVNGKYVSVCGVVAPTPQQD